MTLQTARLDDLLRNVHDLQMVQESTHCFKSRAELYQLARRAIRDKECTALIKQKVLELPTEDKEKALIHLAHARVREATNCPLTRSGLDLALMNPYVFLQKLFKITSLEQLQRDVQQLSRTLAPRSQIIKGTQPGQCIQRGISSLSGIPIDAVLMFGNNDLAYVDYAANLIRSLPNVKQIKIYVMGFGGYGTTAGAIFYHTEAQTIAERLHDLGLSREQIVLETNSTTTDQNIRFLGDLLKQEAADPKNFLLFGTPLATFRQSRMLEKIASFPWSQIITYPTDTFFPYFDTEEKAGVNFLFAAREFLTVMYWLIERKTKISTRPIEDTRLFSQNFTLICHYFESLTKHKLPFDKERFLTDFLRCEEPSSSEFATGQGLAIRKQIVEILNLLSTFFRLNFENQAITYMPRIPSTYTLDEQATLLNNARSTRLNGLCIEKLRRSTE